MGVAAPGPALFPTQHGMTASFGVAPSKVSFEQVPGKPIFFYRQKTCKKGSPETAMHAESGYLRLGPPAGGPGKAQLVIAQITGTLRFPLVPRLFADCLARRSSDAMTLLIALTITTESQASRRSAKEAQAPHASR